MRITSVHNPRVKEAVRLRQRRGRQRQRRFIIDGRREIASALAAGYAILEVFVHPATSGDPAGTNLRHELEERGAICWEVSADVCRKLSFGDRDEGFVAIGQPRPARLEDFTPPSPACLVILDGVEKPGNIGAVLRTADATGASALIVTNSGTDLFNPNVIRASLGTVFTLPNFAADPPRVLAWLRQHGVATYAARVDGATLYDQHDFRGSVALVLGSEAEGLASVWEGGDVRGVRLPMVGRVDSLNVSITAAVLLYEVARQRGWGVADQADRAPRQIV